MTSHPSWLWLSWIPQLLSALFFKESIHVVSVLIQIAKDYPQALFYPLNTFLHDLSQKQNQSENLMEDETSSSSYLQKNRALEHAHTIMNAMKNFHSSLVKEMTLLVSEFEASLSPKDNIYCIEELTSILNDCYFSSFENEEAKQRIQNRIQEFLDSELFQKINGTDELVEDLFNIKNHNSSSDPQAYGNQVISKLKESIKTLTNQ